MNEHPTQPLTSSSGGRCHGEDTAPFFCARISRAAPPLPPAPPPPPGLGSHIRHNSGSGRSERSGHSGHSKRILLVAIFQKLFPVRRRVPFIVLPPPQPSPTCPLCPLPRTLFQQPISEGSVL